MIWADRLAIVWALLLAVILVLTANSQSPPVYGHWVDQKACTPAQMQQIARTGQSTIPCGSPEAQYWVADNPTSTQLQQEANRQAAVPGTIFEMVLLLAGLPWLFFRGVHFVLTGRIAPKRWHDTY